MSKTTEQPMNVAVGFALLYRTVERASLSGDSSCCSRDLRDCAKLHSAEKSPSGSALSFRPIAFKTEFDPLKN